MNSIYTEQQIGLANQTKNCLAQQSPSSISHDTSNIKKRSRSQMNYDQLHTIRNKSEHLEGENEHGSL